MTPAIVALRAAGVREGGRTAHHVVVVAPVDAAVFAMWTARVRGGASLRWRRIWDTVSDGVLKAYDTASADDQTTGIHLDELVGDMPLWEIFTAGSTSTATGNVNLRTQGGSILNAKTNPDEDNVRGDSVDLDANGGSIGLQSKDVMVDSGRAPPFGCTYLNCGNNPVTGASDPALATAAWKEGHHDWVVQTPAGTPHGAYGGFTNVASKAVQQYNLDIASEAASAGVVEILYDYIRRPEGDLTQIVFPGMPSDDDAVKSGVATFLTRSHELLRAKGVYQGASLFGIAAGDPAAVGQNVPLIARHVDYIAPMVYPSLWTDQQYKVNHPALNPYTIVNRSLEDFKAKAAGTGVHWTPWLQDFSLDGVRYSDTQVWQQIRGAQDTGMDDFLLWSPRVVYHGGQLQTDARD